MADESFQEKTEQATPRRRREAREKGEVPKSIEINSVVVLLIGLLALRFFGNGLYNRLTGTMRFILSRLSMIELSVETIPQYTLSGFQLMGVMVGPIVLMIMIAGVSANVLQSGFVFSSEPIKPKFNKISPMKGFKKMFSLRSLVELAKNLFKLAVVGSIGYLTLKSKMLYYPTLVDKNIAQIVAFISSVCFQLVLRVGLALLLMAVLDFAYQRFEFEKKLRMTHQEVKEEYKRTEGDPLIKSRIRSIQLKQARQRMLSAVPEADVVITNPIHLAIALKYESNKMTAPTVVAKGARLVAEKIKEIAAAHDVPVIENKPLARVLFKSTEIGMEIPLELFKVVAEVLAYVYKLKKRVV